uniref:Uncharacterized protein n=1 Tax=Setaria italica TaxID=4555 RepID=K3Y0M8_SETIT
MPKSGEASSLTMTRTSGLRPSHARRQWVFRSGQVRTNQGFGSELLSPLAHVCIQEAVFKSLTEYMDPRH